ncbi:MAG: glutamate--tRNA ligase [Candidatus Sungbacteria bacterium]|nr:glutamate--tRNA ligase [Candidatus Sungbacteria bacterium]
MNVRVRIAPSPTGHLHVGTARSALFNYLFAKKAGGEFILRIEDTDRERSKKEYEEGIIESLKWLGLDWDEGPIRQSERVDIYKKYISQLLKNGKAFACFCEKNIIEKELKDDQHYMHYCPSRNDAFNSNEIRPFVIAYKNDDFGEQQKQLKHELQNTKKIGGFRTVSLPTETKTWIEFSDEIRGEFSFPKEIFGDFIIAKSLEEPLYNFAAVVDDYEMKISDVIRGEDHLPNTPKQILLYGALGWQPPKFAHLPLLLGTDRSKLSKRHGATSVIEFRKEGYLPEALINFLALLGWNPGGEQEIFSLNELIEKFSLDKVNKSGAIFDIAKLDWMNGEYIHKMAVSKLADLLSPFMDNAGLDAAKMPKEKLEKIVALEQPRLKRLAEIGEKVKYFFRQPEYDKELLRWKNMSDEEVADCLKTAEKIISNFQFPISKAVIEKAFLHEIGEGDKGRVLWPLRVALTGLRSSPGPFDIIEILGRDESISRLRRAINLL